MGVLSEWRCCEVNQSILVGGSPRSVAFLYGNIILKVRATIYGSGAIPLINLGRYCRSEPEKVIEWARKRGEA